MTCLELFCGALFYELLISLLLFSADYLSI